MRLSAGARLGSYEILAPLGAGGMGEVYRARDTRLGREVALKVLPEDLSSERNRLARFEREARSASALNHPNIVTVHEIGSSDSTAFIAMELVDGKTLRELTVSGPLPARRILNISAQIAEGLAKAHSAGIVHRDLKPENVMVSKDGFVKILDFGLAKLTEPESGEASAMPTMTDASPQTRPGTVLGTVSYMSPEQASGEPVDFRSDQFALGSMLYEMATGEKAFARKTAAETMATIIREEPEPLGRRRPETPLPLRWIVERCLAKDPEERYASTRDLARDLAGVRDHISEVSSAGEALLASPARRRRSLLPLAAAGLLLAGALAGAWLAPRLWQRPSASAPSFHRLTFRRGSIGNARFTPDGTVVYGATWEGAGPDMRLYSTRPESPESRLFDFPTADIFAVSLQSELAIRIERSRGLGEGTLARVPFSGGVAREVIEGIPYAGADWAPDGKRLAVIRSAGGKDRLEFPIGTVLLESNVLESPRFSPEGDRIAFFEGGREFSVDVIDATGKRKKTHSGGWARVAGVPCWTPDGQEIWFTASEGGSPEALFAVDLSGKRRLVTRVPGILELDDISPDGRVLLAHHTVVISVFARAADASKELDLSWLDASFPADLSLDGKTLLLTERGEGSGPAPSVYLRRTDGSPALRLGEGRAIALSPDQKSVLASATSEKGKPPRLTLLPTGAGEARALENDRFTGFHWAAFSPGGESVFFSASEEGKRPRLYVQEVRGGKPQPIGPEGYRLQPFTKALSPDGRRLIARDGSEKYWSLTVESGTPQPIAGLSSEDWPVGWSADGRSLLVQSLAASSRIWLLDPETGKRRIVKEIVPADSAARVGRVVMTPDGRSYAYQTRRTFSELYMVEGLK